MGSLPNRCALHPQRRVVGICALCLRDRLTLLIDSGSPDASSDGEHESKELPPPRVPHGDPPGLPLPPPLPHPLPRDRSEPGSNPNAVAPADTLHHHTKLEDSINSALLKVKQAHEQLSFAAHSPYQGVVKLDPAASPLPPDHTSLPAGHRRSHASAVDAKSFPGAIDISGKRKSTWFSISRGKNSLPNSPLPQTGRGPQDKNGLQSAPQAAIAAGRKSASDAMGRSCNSYRQAYTAELGSISHINLGDAAIKVERNECQGDARGNSSWISSFFHRRKGSQHKADDKQHAGLSHCGSSPAAFQMAADGYANRSPLPSFEAGRLSWDGPRPIGKQMRNRMESTKKHQRIDCSPLHNFAATSGGNECLETSTLGQSPSIYKCSSAAASRRSTSGLMPSGSTKQARLSPLMQSDQNGHLRTGAYREQMIGRESRSWGRAWNRALSPLLGFRTNGGKSSADPSPQHHSHTTANNHLNHRNAIYDAPSAAGSYMNTLSKRQCAPDAQIQVSQ